MIKLPKTIAVSLSILAMAAGVFAQEDKPANGLPAFQELYDLIKTHLKTLNETELNDAAVLGMLDRLKSDVILVTTNGVATPSTDAKPLVAKKALYEQQFGYIRLAQVESGAAVETKKAFDELAASNKVNGVVIDLRFAGGHDYAAAGAIADLFVASDQPLLEFGGQTVSARADDEGIKLSTVVLVNQKTTGASEALAAALREFASALIIGNVTAGRARVFEDFTLKNGRKIKLAAQMVKLGGGKPVPDKGVQPDVQVNLPPEDEQAYLEDPWARLTARSTLPRQRLAANSSTNSARARRRLNEADLIRLRREGLDFEEETTAPEAEMPDKPVINDPVLARALDLLKGLALMQKRR